jgi:hypothetical protein
MVMCLRAVNFWDFVMGNLQLGMCQVLEHRTTFSLPMTGETIFMNMDNIGQFWLAMILWNVNVLIALE